MNENSPIAPIVVGVTGAGGLIGEAVCQKLQARGVEVIAFTRNPQKVPAHCTGARAFSLAAPVDLSGMDALVHLAGESIMGFWSAEKKRRILQSRVDGTRHLVQAMAQAPRLKAFACASAIGFYGNGGDSALTEEAPKGKGFLSDVVQAWESEAKKAEAFEKRVSVFRLGMVLAKGGGALHRIVPLFRLGLGGKLGNGQQWMSAIHLDDAAELFCRSALEPCFSGTYNAVMPESLRNSDFTRLLGKTVCRPTLFATPAWILRMVLGELSSLLLFSQKVIPHRLQEEKYTFSKPDFSSALQEFVR